MNEKKDQGNIIHELIQKIDQNPHQVSNYYALAMILVEQQNFDQAEELLVKAKGLFKDQESLNLLVYGLGNVYYASGLYEKANNIFQTITDKKLKGDANLMIAQGYYAQSQYELAFAFGLTALESKPDDADINELMGDIALARGDQKLAKKYYDIALKSKKTAKLLFNRGVVEMLVSNSKNNLFFEQSKAIDPDFFAKSRQRLIDIDKLLNQTEEKD